MQNRPPLSGERFKGQAIEFPARPNYSIKDRDMKQISTKIIDLPRSHYRVLNPSRPPRWVLATVALIILSALAWAVIGG